MTWYEFALPAVAIALLARIEAVFVGPYWSWIEMFPEVEEESSDVRRERRKSFWRRVAIPGIVGFAAAGFWPSRFSETSLAIVGAGAAGLLLWPLVFHGLPWGVRGTDWQVPLIYLSLVAAFSASAWLGGHIAHWGIGREGGIGEVLLENLFSLIIAAVLMGVATTTLETVATLASRRRQARQDE